MRIAPRIRFVLALALGATGTAPGCDQVSHKPVKSIVGRIQFPPIGDQSVSLGETLTFDVIATQTQKKPLTFSASPVPLPRNTCFNVQTGAFTFSPEPAQVTDANVPPIEVSFSVTDGFKTVSQSVAITVTSRPDTEATILVGEVLAPETQFAVVGAEVRAPVSGDTTTVGLNGKFSLTIDPAEPKVEIDGMDLSPAYAFVAEDITLLLGHPIYAGQINEVPNSIYIPLLGEPAGVIDPNVDSELSNPDAGVRVLVTAGSATNADGSPFSGEMFLPEVPRDQTPAALPENLTPAMVIAIQPAELSFNPPAAITFPNRDNLAPGTETDIWSIDPSIGRFAIAGRGRVSDDGTVIETIEGGISSSSWHFPAPAPPASDNGTGDSPGDNSDPNDSDCSSVGSRADAKAGNLAEDIFLPSWSTLGQRRELQLVYSSNAAFPCPTVAADLLLPVGADLPVSYESILDVGGMESVYDVFTTASNAALRHAVRFEAAAFGTGRYSYVLRSRSHYAGSAVGTRVNGTVLVNNQIDSPFGAGWDLAGLQRIWIPQNDPTVTLTEGDGAILAFSPRNESETDVLTDLAFVMDGSKSISPTEFALALSGISGSIRDPAIVPHDGSVAVTFVQFAADSNLVPVARIDLPLTVIDSTATANTVADTIDAITKLGTGPGTPIFKGVDEAVVAVGAGHPGARQVMCVTTDGATGRPADAFASADAAIAAGFEEIDAIAIGDGVDFDFLDDFVRNGFVETAQSFEDFADAVPSKLRLVIGGSPPGDFTQMIHLDAGTYQRVTKDKTVYRFGSTGLLESMTDRNGNVTTYQRDISGRLAAIVDPTGVEARFAYGLDGKLESITDPLGRVTRFTHDDRGDLVEVEFPDGSRRGFGYDDRHRLISQTDASGFVTRYEYDHGSRFSRSIRPDASTTSFIASEVAALVADPAKTSKFSPATALPAELAVGTTIDAVGEKRTIRFDRLGGTKELADSIGIAEQATFDVNGLRTSHTLPSGRVDKANFDSLGNPTSLVEADGSTVARARQREFASPFNFMTADTNGDGFTTRYDHSTITGDLLTITDARGKTRDFTYDANGLPATMQDELDRVTQFFYDPLGNLETVVDPLGNVTRYERDGAGNVTKIIEGLGSSAERVRQFEYDALNRLTRDIDGAGGVTRYAYDARGNLVTTTLPTGEVERRTYDTRNRLVTLDDPVRGVSTYVYDAKGRLVSETNALGARTSYAYDARDRVTQKTDALGQVERYGYDADGNLATITNGNGKTFMIAHDLLGRRVSFMTPLGRLRTWEYDLRDNLLFARVQGGPSIEHQYDELSRLTLTLAGDNTITRTYDDASQLLGVTDSDSNVGFGYDAASRLATATTLAGGAQPLVTLTYGYDAAGNLVSLADSVAGTHLYGYDGAGRLTVIQPPSGGSLFQSYDATGRLAGISYPNGIQATYSYAGGRLTRIQHQLAASNVLDLVYSHNAIGNITELTEPTLDATFGYDAVEQLTDGVTVAGTESFGYDAAGNRLAGGALYNDDNQLVDDAAYTYAYNARGDRVSRARKSDGVVTTYTWSNLGQLIAISEPGGNSSSYRYDGLGRRIEKTVNGVVTKYVYDRDDLVAEYTSTNVLKTRYTHGSGIDRPLALATGGANYWYHADHLGSIRVVTDATGAIVNDYEYSAYGILDSSSVEGVEQPYGYTGREDASEAGLWFYRARYYEPGSGVFVSEDPLLDRAGSTNCFRYSANNPIVYLDPTGLAECEYSVSSHTMICRPSNPEFVGPGVGVGPDGVFSGIGGCTNNMSCVDNADEGPIPPGRYNMNEDNRPGHEKFWRLEPNPKIPGWKCMLGLARCGFEFHPGSVSLGCITADQTRDDTMQQYNNVNNLLQSESGRNHLTVVP